MRELRRAWGERVRQRRVELGLSQQELAQRAGLSQGLVSKIERGKGLSDETKYKLADALGERVERLFPYPPRQSTVTATGAA